MSLRSSAVALVTALTFTTTTLGSSVAFAQPAAPQATDAQKTEARDRFDRGLRLFNEGDNAGALAEFKRAYEVIPNPVLLLNIGLTYAAMSRPVEAVDAFEKLLASPGAVSADRLARAKSARDEQALRIAEVNVTVNVKDATLEVDNVAVGRTPLAAPLRVSSGTHIIGAVAPGYSPARKEVTVAGKTRAELTLDLVAMQGRLAHLDIKTHLPGADVVVDGDSVAKTPLPASLTVSPGGHKIELRRAGYKTAKQDILLGDGATGEMTLDPEIDEAALSTDGGTLTLDITETEAVVRIDGRQLGIYVGPLRLPPGVHHLDIDRGGFYPFARDITVPATMEVNVRAVLDPKPETRADFVSTARAHRIWGLVGIISGVAIGGAGGVWLAVNSSKKKPLEAAYDAQEAAVAKGSKQPCDAAGPGDHDACNATLTNDYDQLKSQQNKDIIGYVGVITGGALVVAGAVVLFTGNNPSRYDRKSSGETLSWSLAPFGDGVRTHGAALVGTF